MRRANGRRELRKRPLGELASRLASDTTALVRQEVELAKAELAEKGKKAGSGVAVLAGAAAVALLALGALTAALILALDAVMPAWAAALVVGLVYAVVAGVLALAGSDRLKQAAPPVPEQTIETVKEDVEWAKTQVRSGTR